jgi:hypothetical protein
MVAEVSSGAARQRETNLNKVKYNANHALVRPLLLIVASVTLYGTQPASLRANIFVANTLSGTIGEYTNSGTVIDESLVTDLDRPTGLAISGHKLFVLDSRAGTVGLYTTSGQTLNSSLITGLTSPTCLAVSAGKLYIGSNALGGSVGIYSVSGTTLNPALITGVSPALDFRQLSGIGVSGDNLFVASWGTNNGLSYLSTIGKYSLEGLAVDPALILTDGIATAFGVAGSQIFLRNSPSNEETRGIDTIGSYTTSGEVINPLLISGLTDPFGIAVLGDNVFVANHNISSDDGFIGQYTTSGGTVDDSLIRGLEFPTGIVVTTSGVPEGFATGWLVLPVLLLMGIRCFRKITR